MACPDGPLLILVPDDQDILGRLPDRLAQQTDPRDRNPHTRKCTRARNLRPPSLPTLKPNLQRRSKALPRELQVVMNRWPQTRLLIGMPLDLIVSVRRLLRLRGNLRLGSLAVQKIIWVLRNMSGQGARTPPLEAKRLSSLVLCLGAPTARVPPLRIPTRVRTRTRRAPTRKRMGDTEAQAQIRRGIMIRPVLVTSARTRLSSNPRQYLRVDFDSNINFPTFIAPTDGLEPRPTILTLRVQQGITPTRRYLIRKPTSRLETSSSLRTEPSRVIATMTYDSLVAESRLVTLKIRRIPITVDVHQQETARRPPQIAPLNASRPTRNQPLSSKHLFHLKTS